jgi:hypothetical protein
MLAKDMSLMKKKRIKLKNSEKNSPNLMEWEEEKRMKNLLMIL